MAIGDSTVDLSHRLIPLLHVNEPSDFLTTNSLSFEYLLGWNSHNHSSSSGRLFRARIHMSEYKNKLKQGAIVELEVVLKL